MSKRSNACEFSPKAKAQIRARDKDKCIFCQIGYHMPPEEFTASQTIQIMHFIPRSQGGLGIPENGAVGCVYHHMLLDNGRDNRDEMMELFQAYLLLHHENWNRKELIYDKWSWLKRT